MTQEQRCGGAGEFEVGTYRDEFGNWDTETFECPGCPDCWPTIVERLRAENGIMRAALEGQGEAEESLADTEPHMHVEGKPLP